MGNSSSSTPLPDQRYDPKNDLDEDDFEPIDKPASPTTWTSPFLSSSANDLATSGILVERMNDNEEEQEETTTKDDQLLPIVENQSSSNNAEGRRILKVSTKYPTKVVESVSPANAGSTNTSALDDDKGDFLHHHALPKTVQSDEELLEESLVKDKQSRLTKLQQEQKAKRNKAVDDRRKGGSTEHHHHHSTSTANPFSRFLSVFSVEPQFPSHKRPYEPSSTNTESMNDPDKVNELEQKRAKVDPEAEKNIIDHYENDDDENAETTKSILSTFHDWCDHHLPVGWPWMAAATTGLLTVVVVMASSSSSKNGSCTNNSCSIGNNNSRSPKAPSKTW